MHLKRIAAFAAAALLSLAMAAPAFAETSIDDFDADQYKAVTDIVRNQVNDDVAEDEQKIVKAIKDKLQSQGLEFNSREDGYKLITEVGKEHDFKVSQWKSAFMDACSQLGVPSSDSTLTEDAQALVDGQAVKKLHILQWDEDTGGVNRSAMKLMLEKILASAALRNVMGMCMAIASAMCVAFGLGDIIQKATEKSASMEEMWRAFLKMCLGIFIIYNCLYIAAFLIYTGSAILTAALGKVTEAGDVTEAAGYQAHMAMWVSVSGMEEAGGFMTVSQNTAAGAAAFLKNLVKGGFGTITEAIGGAKDALSNPLQIIGSLFNLPLAAMGATAGTAIIQFVMSLSVYAVAINTGVRFVFTPLAVADLFSERFRSTGVRWLKSLAAAALQGVIIFVVYMVGTELTEVLSGGSFLPGFSPVTNIVIYATMIGMFAKSGGIAGEIVGSR